MQCYVIGLVASDLILRLIGAGVVSISSPINVLSMHFNDGPAHAPGFRIPTDVIADFELRCHDVSRPTLDSLPTSSILCSTNRGRVLFARWLLEDKMAT